MDLITKYFPKLSETQQKQIDALDANYRDWNAKINVISRKDIDNLYLHHVLHSLAIAKTIHFRPGTRILDFGCGGGFPWHSACHFVSRLRFPAHRWNGKEDHGGYGNSKSHRAEERRSRAPSRRGRERQVRFRRLPGGHAAPRYGEDRAKEYFQRAAQRLAQRYHHAQRRQPR